MLRVSIHAGLLAQRCAGNQLGALDIAYQKKAPLADYLVALCLRQQGELEPRVVQNYPRWAGSLWDLTARALSQSLYKLDAPPPAQKVDRRCAYATKMCAVIQLSTADGTGRQLGAMEVLQRGNVRGEYTASFAEDILGGREAQFAFGAKVLNHAELVLRSICHAYFGTDSVGKRPRLILPPSMVIEGKERFDIEGLDEPARTGFNRHRATVAPLAKPEPMPLASDYAAFLMRG
jgi:hypothetical protein